VRRLRRDESDLPERVVRSPIGILERVGVLERKLVGLLEREFVRRRKLQPPQLPQRLLPGGHLHEVEQLDVRKFWQCLQRLLGDGADLQQRQLFATARRRRPLVHRRRNGINDEGQPLRHHARSHRGQGQRRATPRA
jgi:hypothetical protein